MNIKERLDKVRELLPDEDISITIPIRVLNQWLGEPEEVVVDLTVEEFAARLGNRTPGTIRNWCARGLIPEAYKLNGKEWRIPEAALNTLPGVPQRTKNKRKVVDISEWRNYT